MMKTKASNPPSGAAVSRLRGALTWFLVGLALLPVTLLCAAWTEASNLLIPVAMHFVVLGLAGLGWDQWVHNQIALTEKKTEKDSEHHLGEPISNRADAV